jgi:hypothetical protein
MISSSFSYAKSSKRDKKGKVVHVSDVKMKLGGPLGATAATVCAVLQETGIHVAGSG